MTGTLPSDEGRHPHADDLLWEEAWHLDFATLDGSLGGHLRLTLLPNLGVSWVWAAVVGEGRRLVSVVEHDAPIPRRGALDLRCEGLWVDLVCEEPLRHWSVGLEAFGVALDDPADALGDGRGERVGVGFDLGWETVVASAPEQRPGGRYDLACDVSGEVLLGDEVITFDGWGSRYHSWGVRAGGPGTTGGAGRLEDGTRWVLPGTGATATVAPPGAPPVSIGAVAVADDDGPGGSVGVVQVDVGDLGLRNEVQHLSPVPVMASGARLGRVVHALCRTSTDDARTGAAWLVLDRPA